MIRARPGSRRVSEGLRRRRPRMLPSGNTAGGPVSSPVSRRRPRTMDVQLFDTTLRDGTQSEGLSLSVEDKLKISRLLDGFGIRFIEGGYPGSNPKDIEFFRRARGLRLKQAKLTAFGSTRKAGAPARGRPGRGRLDHPV